MARDFDISIMDIGRVKIKDMLDFDKDKNELQLK